MGLPAPSKVKSLPGFARPDSRGRLSPHKFQPISS